MNTLQLTRKAAYVINEIVRELQLGNLGEQFSGDDATQWNVMDEYWVICSKNERHIADIIFYPAPDGSEKVEVTIQNAYLLIRPQHIRDFDPRQYGITINNVPDWKGDTAPDLIIHWPLPDHMPISSGPRNYIPPTTSMRRPRVISSIH